MTPEAHLSLPFLNKVKQNSGLIVKTREPDQDTAEEVNPDSLEDCVERLLKAFASKDKSEIAQALRDVHDELHLEMSESKEDSNSYEAQNKKAVAYSKE